MPAMIVRLTAEPADGGVEELQILEDDGVAEQVLPQRLISKLTLTRVPTCDKPSTIVMSLSEERRKGQDGAVNRTLIRHVSHGTHSRSPCAWSR